MKSPFNLEAPATRHCLLRTGTFPRLPATDLGPLSQRARRCQRSKRPLVIPKNFVVSGELVPLLRRGSMKTETWLMPHTFCRRASWERRRLGGQAYQKPHFYYLHRIALIETQIFGGLLPARRRRSQGSRKSLVEVSGGFPGRFKGSKVRAFETWRLTMGWSKALRPARRILYPVSA